MMELSEIYGPANIKVDLTSRTKEELFDELVEFLAAREGIENIEEIREALWDREHMLNTVIAPSVALPHASLRKQKEALGVIGLSRDGVDYGDKEWGTVHVIMLLVDNRFETKKHLRTLRGAATLIRSPNFLSKVMGCTTPEQVHDVILEVEDMQRV